LFTIPSGSGCEALTAGRGRERRARIATCRAPGLNSLPALKRIAEHIRSYILFRNEMGDKV
jgi:hypothetical protein